MKTFLVAFASALLAVLLVGSVVAHADQDSANMWRMLRKLNGSQTKLGDIQSATAGSTMNNAATTDAGNFAISYGAHLTLQASGGNCYVKGASNDGGSCTSGTNSSCFKVRATDNTPFILSPDQNVLVVACETAADMIHVFEGK